MTAKEYQDKWERENGECAEYYPSVYAEDYAHYRMKELIESLTDDEAEQFVNKTFPIEGIARTVQSNLKKGLGAFEGIDFAQQYYLNKIKEG